jgi:hypothetical protein
MSRGRLGLRVAAGLVVVAAASVTVTERLNYWIPSSARGPALVAALLAGALGILALVGMFDGVTFGGVSAACGLAAVIAYLLTVAGLSELGSYDDDALHVAAVALGGLALAAGLAALSMTWTRPGRRWAMSSVAVAVLGALLVWRVAVARYPVYADRTTQLRHVAIAAASILAFIVLAGVVSLRCVRPRVALLPTSDRRRPTELSDVEGTRPSGTDVSNAADVGQRASEVLRPAIPSDVAAPAAEPQAMAVGSRPVSPKEPSRLQFAATAVGLVSGMLSIGREVVDVIQALFR